MDTNNESVREYLYPRQSIHFNDQVRTARFLPAVDAMSIAVMQRFWCIKPVGQCLHNPGKFQLLLAQNRGALQWR